MACMPKSAIAVKPRVWNQLVPAGMLRNISQRPLFFTPDRSSTKSTTWATPCSTGFFGPMSFVVIARS